MNASGHRRLALRATASALSLLAAMPALGQVATAPAQDQDPNQVETSELALPGDESDVIIVTGSRLARDPNAVAALPVTAVSAEDFALAGNNDVTATLRQVPALVASTTVADSIERGGGNVGVAALNLRQLGSNRTLVLVNGKRHVSGVADSVIVDVSTIPPPLIRSVEVLTGGASAVYGADAVTGVVNYILREDFEGLEINGYSGVSGKGDGQSWRIAGTFGKNFAEGRGNVTISAGYAGESEVLLGDRDFTRDNGRANNSTTYANPALRFQKGDINPATMPNFAARYSQAAGRLPYGYSIPTPAQFASFFPGATPTAAEQALIERAANSPTRIIARQPTFAISSASGLVFRADYGFFNADINGNGINDCEESFVGLTGFGGGGCYVTTPDGGVKIFEDGIVSTSSNQFGGDGAAERDDPASLTPGSKRIFLVSTGRYEFTPAVEFFYDAKYARNTATSRDNYNTFYDSLYISPENPFIPAVLLPDALDAGGLLVSRDFFDLGPGISTAERETLRFVGGLRGDVSDHLSYEVAGNWGQTKATETFSNSVRYDRLFAAMDVVRGPGGQPVCRSELDPTQVPPGSDIFPEIEAGFFTFTPGQGLCKPANIMAGKNSVSPEAVAFITTPTTDNYRINQSVVTGQLSGDMSKWFTLPGGPVQFAFGFEWRKERSESILSDLEKGLLPEGSPAGPAGTFIGDISANQSLIFDAQNRVFDSGGQFTVTEFFTEFLLPVLKDRRFAQELSLGGAVRYADYSTVGGATTWNFNGIWAPVEPVKFRGTFSQAIRAPDIFELFSPQQGATFRPLDPCNASEIRRLRDTNAPNAETRAKNCLAAVTATGIANPAQFLANYEDPLTARFGGTSGGNPDLSEETATTWTVGTVLQPVRIPGLVLTADYYSITIEDAIAAVSSQDIVNTCYDLPTYPNQFCDLFQRRVEPSDVGSPTFFGFRSLNQTQVNFGRLETSGVDFTANYIFDVKDSNFALGFNGNWTQKLNRFFDPVQTDLVNPGLQELGAPRWAGNTTVTWNLNRFTMGYRMQWIGRQAIASAIQIERLEEEFGPAGLAPNIFVHDLAFQFALTEQFMLSAGINNLLNEKPYLASSAYPVSGVGRFLFMSIDARF